MSEGNSAYCGLARLALPHYPEEEQSKHLFWPAHGTCRADLMNTMMSRSVFWSQPGHKGKSYINSSWVGLSLSAWDGGNEGKWEETKEQAAVWSPWRLSLSWEWLQRGEDGSGTCLRSGCCGAGRTGLQGNCIWTVVVPLGLRGCPQEPASQEGCLSSVSLFGLDHHGGRSSRVLRLHLWARRVRLCLYSQRALN